MNPDQQNPYGQPVGPNQTPQQASSGQYQVVPPLPAGQNNGHSGHNPYEFIVAPVAPKRPGLNLTGEGMLTKIALLGGGVVVLLIVLALVLSAFKPKGITAGLTAIAQRQQEIVRVATAAGQQASSDDGQNFVATVSLTVGSDQQQVLAYLAGHKVKLKTKTLAADQSAQTDSQLANAASAGTYDSAVVQDLKSQLQTYEGLLQTTYKQTSSQTARQLLNNAYQSAVKLVNETSSLNVSGS